MQTDFLPRDAMHKRGICRHAVFVCLSVCLSVTFVSCVKTNKHIFEIFSPSGSQAILVFFTPNGVAIFRREPPPLTGASNAGGVGKKRDSGRDSGAGCIGHVCIGAYSMTTT